MEVCIVGGGGFVGSHIADAFLKMGDDVYVVEHLSSYRPPNGPDGFILSTWWDGVEESEGKPRMIAWSGFPERQYDLVVNCACRDLPFGIGSPFTCYDETVQALLGLLRSMSKGRFERLLQISSAEADHPSTFYGAAKASCDLLIGAASSQLGLGVLKPYKSNNLFGPRQLAPALIPNTIRSWLEGRPVKIYGSIENVRNYSWVVDAAETIARIGHGDQPKSIKAWSASIRDVLESVKKTGLVGVHEVVDPRPGDYTIKKRHSSPDRLFDEYMEMTVDWFKKHTEA